MSTLDQVMDLKERGVPDSEIVRQLQEQGIPPMQINDALSRAQIKSAVSDTKQGPKNVGGMQRSSFEAGEEAAAARLPTENISDEDLNPPVPTPGGGKVFPGGYATQEVSEGVPSSPQASETYYPQEQEYPSQEQQYYPQEQQQFQQAQEYYPSPDAGYDYSGSYGQYAGISSGDADTVIEIAEQVFSEKIKDLQKKIEEVSEFKTLAQTKIEHISGRLKKIEETIDMLQGSVLEKVGSYGGSLEAIRKEMSMMQNSFSKMVGHAASKTHTSSSHKSSGTKTVHRTRKTTRRSSKR